MRAAAAALARAGGGAAALAAAAPGAGAPRAGRRLARPARRARAQGRARAASNGEGQGAGAGAADAAGESQSSARVEADAISARRRHKYAVKLSYDGSGFAGFQLQRRQGGSDSDSASESEGGSGSDGGIGVGRRRMRGLGAPRTVQGEVERVLPRLTGADRAVLGVAGVGRTDSGVHARAQWVHFWTEQPLRGGGAKLLGGLNGLLDADVRCHDALEVPPQFHARRSALTKEYRYEIDFGPHADPLRRSHALFLHRPLDVARVAEACALFEGTHDFSSFANRTRDRSKQPNPVRTVSRCWVEETRTGIVIAVRGPGFLYRQVRNMVGAIIRVGDGKSASEEITRLLEAKDRGMAPKSAPAHGLYLHDVEYPDFVFDHEYCAERGTEVFHELLALKGIQLDDDADVVRPQDLTALRE